MQHKVLSGDAQVKLQDTGAGSLTFYASSFANWDRVRPIPERPTKGAFAPHLAAFVKDGFIGVAHDWDRLPVATVTSAQEDDFGLLVTADFHTTPDAQAARAMISERLSRGKSVKTSIGYDVLADMIVPMDDPTLQAEGIERGRLLKELYLYEISIVNVPMNPLADVTAVKARPTVAAVKDMMDGGMPLDWQAQDLLMCLLDYVREGRLLSEADPAALVIAASLLREALDTVGNLIPASTQTAAKAVPPRRMAFDLEGDRVLRALTLFAKRAENRAAAYARKEGRVLSTANRTKLSDLRSSLRDVLAILEDLLAAAEPKSAAIDLTPEYYRFLLTEARLNGVTL